MNLDTKKVISIVKIISLDIKLSAEKVIVVLIFEISGGGICIAIFLINQDITMLFQIVVLISKIRYLETIIFFLVSCLVNIIIKEQYP